MGNKRLRSIILKYRMTEMPRNLKNLLDFPVDWREPSEKPHIIYEDVKSGKDYSLERMFPYPCNIENPNRAYFELLNSKRFILFPVRKVKVGKISREMEAREFDPRTDVPTEIEGTVVMKIGRDNIFVVDKGQMWAYNFKRERD